jgi:hypothetical protein
VPRSYLGALKAKLAGMTGEGFGAHEHRDVVAFVSESRSDQSTDCTRSQNGVLQAVSPRKNLLITVPH